MNYEDELKKIALDFKNGNISYFEFFEQSFIVCNKPLFDILTEKLSEFKYDFTLDDNK